MRRRASRLLFFSALTATTHPGETRLWLEMEDKRGGGCTLFLYSMHARDPRVALKGGGSELALDGGGCLRSWRWDPVPLLFTSLLIPPKNEPKITISFYLRPTLQQLRNRHGNPLPSDLLRIFTKGKLVDWFSWEGGKVISRCIVSDALLR